jgi:WS/DGAT/MGAT family acyltransferase
MERMSVLDAGFLFIENENAPMHVGSVTIFEGPAPTYGDLVRLLLAKIPGVPRYRQRVRSLPLTLGLPVWVDDEHFQILYHVRHTAVPRPGGDEQLRNLAGRIFAQRLDLTKPLWEVWLVEGLKDGHWALISKVHHCMVDGVAGNDLMTTIFDLTPDAEHSEPAPWHPEPAPSAISMITTALVDTVGESARRLAALPELARRVRGQRGMAEFGRGLVTAARRLAVPTTSALGGPVGPHRRWVWTHAELAEIKKIRQALGGTVNDVVLAATTSGFRALLTARDVVGEDEVVRSLVPISVRAPGEQGVLNNQISAVLVNLPVGEPDPLRRLSIVREQMDDIKNTRQAVGAEVLTGLAGLAAPTLLALGSKIAVWFPQPLVQTVTTNVPGPRFPLYVLGRRLIELYPYVPISGGLPISVGIFSYIDRLNFGVNADFDGVPDVGVLAEGIRDGFDELAEHAEKLRAESA